MTTYHGIAASLTGPMNGARGRKRKRVPIDLVVLHLWVSPEDGPARYLHHLATPNLPGVSGRVFQSRHPNGSWLWETPAGAQTTDAKSAKMWSGRLGVVWRSKALPYVLVPGISRTPWTYGAGYHGVAGPDGQPYWACDPDLYSVNANPPVNDRAVAFCMPGHYQTRDQWLLEGNSRQFIRAAAAAIVWANQRWDVSLVRLDAKALKSGGRGYCDHATVNAVWRMSNHGDVGRDFPWDVLADDIDNLMGADMARLVRVYDDTTWLPVSGEVFTMSGLELEWVRNPEHLNTLVQTKAASLDHATGQPHVIFRSQLAAFYKPEVMSPTTAFAVDEFLQ